jgi:hypothetical protein
MKVAPKRQDAVLRGHSETIGERLLRDLDALIVLPPAPYDACEKMSTRATSISMVRYRGNDYSVPVAYAHHEVQVRGYLPRARVETTKPSSYLSLMSGTAA